MQVQKRIVSLIGDSKVMTKCSDNLRFKPYQLAINVCQATFQVYGTFVCDFIKL